MVTITEAQVRAMAPKVSAPMLRYLTTEAPAVLDRYRITTPLRLSHFFAQVQHESGDFRYTHEIWGPTPAQQRYDTRTDLGNTPERDGDGKLYMGHGLIQTTGKANHRLVTERLRARGWNCPDFVAEPHKLGELPWCFVSACDYWDMRGLNALADRDDLLGVTRKVNGGTNGLADRRAQLAEAKRAFGIAGATPTAPGAPVTTTAWLRRGSKGEAVAQLQRDLAALGHRPGKVDGDFGPVTLLALKEFQAAAGLVADGVAGRVTRAALDAALARRTASRVPSKAPSAPRPPTPSTSVGPAPAAEPVPKGGLSRLCAWLLGWLFHA